MSKQYVLYGAGRQGMEALQRYGKDRVAYFCDGFSDKVDIDGIKLIRPEELYEICNNNPDITVVITPKIDKVRAEITGELDKRGIGYLIYGKTDAGAYGSKTFRITGDGSEPQFIIDDEEIKGYRWRVDPTVDMLQGMFHRYADDFKGKKIDMTVFVGDHVMDAYEQRQQQGLDVIFAYSTIYAYSDVVIPIPDYRFCIHEDTYPFEESPVKCALAAKESWSDSRIAWRGTIASSDERKWLDMIAKRNPDKLLVEDPAWEQNDVYIPMTELAKYKYTLDIRGYGWTDRVKVLMQLGRPLFLIERPYLEWYFDKLKPMEHFVPVKEDMSDLIERYDYLEAHPEVYDRLVEGARDFVNKYFDSDYVLKYLRDIVLEYGTVK